MHQYSQNPGNSNNTKSFAKSSPEVRSMLFWKNKKSIILNHEKFSAILVLAGCLPKPTNIMIQDKKTMEQVYQDITEFMQ